MTIEDKIDVQLKKFRINNWVINILYLFFFIFFLFLQIYFSYYPIIETKLILELSVDPSIQCVYDIYNCDDFASEDSANSIFRYCYFLTHQDIHKLDNDNDDYACEGFYNQNSTFLNRKGN